MEEDTLMPRLNELIPQAEVLLALEPEEVAAAIFEVLNSDPNEARHYHPGNFAGSHVGSRQAPYPQEFWEDRPGETWLSVSSDVLR